MNMLSSGPKIAPLPAPVVMPTQNSQATAQAQQEAARASAARTGRASTIMSQQDISKTDTMGG